MNIDIRTTNVPLTDALSSFITSRLSATLSRFNSGVRNIDVTVCDLNGPKGGNDMRCHVEVSLRNDDPVLIEERGDDLYAAIARAAQRAKNAVLRRVDAAKPHKMRFRAA
ncbi:MAG: HPF/RaiA family ribosome-associated protein [Phycisphaerales bacterium]